MIFFVCILSPSDWLRVSIVEWLRVKDTHATGPAARTPWSCSLELDPNISCHCPLPSVGGDNFIFFFFYHAWLLWHACHGLIRRQCSLEFRAKSRKSERHQCQCLHSLAIVSMTIWMHFRGANNRKFDVSWKCCSSLSKKNPQLNQYFQFRRKLLPSGLHLYFVLSQRCLFFFWTRRVSHERIRHSATLK